MTKTAASASREPGHRQRGARRRDRAPTARPTSACPQGLWDRLGGSEGAGEGVIVGIVDTRHHARHPSFADDPADGYRGPPTAPCPTPGTARARPAPGFTAADCNNKLIGARCFVEGFGAATSPPAAFLSPRDDDGHGTHTASTAAGNFGVDPAIDGNDLGVEPHLGHRAARPRRRLQGLLDRRGRQTAARTDDIVGRDRRSGRRRRRRHQLLHRLGHLRRCSAPTGSRFLGASDAGVFVANSAGNDGPGAETVGSPGVGPVAHLGGGRVHPARPSARRRRSPTRPATTSPSRAARRRPRSRRRRRSSTPRTPRWRRRHGRGRASSARRTRSTRPQVAGKVVLCLRGVNDRIEKCKVVAEAGGVGMILYNPANRRT